jgi:DNA-binding CsgD family transcriptional regulator
MTRPGIGVSRMAESGRSGGRRRRVRTDAELLSQSPRDAEVRLRAAEALREMRKGSSLRAAAAREHTTPETVKAHFGHLLTRDGRRYRVAKSDREPFLLDVVGANGPMKRVVRGSRSRQLNQDHHRAIARFASADGGDVRVLDPFYRKRVGGVALLTDPDEIERLAVAGEFDWIDYSSF